MTSPDSIRQLIDARVFSLQSHYLSRDPHRVGDKARAVARLAQLRHAIGKPPGSRPEIWDITIADLPAPGPDEGPPSAQELAAHTAMTLYALHQQARGTEMHQRGVSLGAAVKHLVRKQNRDADAGREHAIRRRFDALVTGASPDEIVHHLRGLVSQLRSEDISLDYGRLADDLERLYARRRFDDVRLAWGRDYHRGPSRQDGSSDAVPTRAKGEELPEEEA